MSQNTETAKIVQIAPYREARTNRDSDRLRQALRQHFASPEYSEEAEEPEEAG